MWTWFPDAHRSKAPNENVAIGATAITNRSRVVAFADAGTERSG
jgi:hypothetical protein